MNLQDPRDPRKANDAWWKRHYLTKRKQARRDRMQAVVPYVACVSVVITVIALIIKL